VQAGALGTIYNKINSTKFNDLNKYREGCVISTAALRGLEMLGWLISLKVMIFRRLSNGFSAA
jgi:hypothetical protein